VLDRIRRAIAPRPVDPPNGLGGGLPFNSLYPDRPGPGVTPPGFVPHRLYVFWGAQTSRILADANPVRRSLVVLNQADQILYVNLGPQATDAFYTEALNPGESLVLEGPDVYLGAVSGFLVQGGVGGAHVTELVG
jgi:hypothetical protein